MAVHVAVIGAGIGGLSAAILLAARGLRVTLVERQAVPGGKMRRLAVGDANIDAGPTVLTMKPVFEALFNDAGDILADHVHLVPASTLARHTWDGAILDLYADRARSADAIASFAGANEGRGFLAFAARAERIWQTLELGFIRAQRPGIARLTARAGPRALAGISPFTTLAHALSEHFRDPRLCQLFARYATYCGSSPYEAPATLMLVAHLESQGVWRVEGGMHKLAQALGDLAGRQGVAFRYGTQVTAITHAARTTGVTLADGEHIEADAVICNADANAVAIGVFGSRAAMRPLKPSSRSLSAITWAAVASPRGFPLLHHNVVFSRNYRAEFDDLRAGRLPAEPTVYLCAQDRADRALDAAGPERLLVLVNAPATGDAGHPTQTEIDRCQDRTLQQLRRCGLTLDLTRSKTTGPTGWETLYPATGGALYGAAAHGWAASFRRPSARTRLPGLYLAGGSTHPGPGIPMAALSGRLAASALIADLDSTARSRRTAMFGGMSTRSATTGSTGSP